MEENVISIELEDGTEMLCEIIFTFHSEDYNKSYVLYTPVNDEDGEVYASSFEEQEEGMGELSDITNDAEWEMIEEVLNTFQAE
jgi:uncharacterized protein YrzB (UPF0473 family)